MGTALSACPQTCCRRSATSSERIPTSAWTKHAANSSTPTGPDTEALRLPGRTTCRGENPKNEIRNPKQNRMSNVANSKRRRVSVVRENDGSYGTGEAKKYDLEERTF